MKHAYQNSGSNIMSLTVTNWLLRSALLVDNYIHDLKYGYKLLYIIAMCSCMLVMQVLVHVYMP